MANRKWTVKRLLSSSGDLRKWRMDMKNYSSSTKRIKDRTIPYAGTKSALFQFSHWGMTEKAVHRIHIQFYGLDISMMEKGEKVKPKKFVVTYQKNRFSVEKPSLNSKVKIRCSCSDFFYRFAFYDFQQGALFGRKPRKPILKGTGKPVNPRHLPGLCKHVVNSILAMRTSRLLVR